MASTATLKYGPNILIAHGTTKGGGSPDPLVVKDYYKSLFLPLPLLQAWTHAVLSEV